jgi:hypothetical protein
VQNGTETDVDCGGANCQPCNIGQKCGVAGDCTTGLCVGNVCVQTCGDGMKDGTETDVDCGGPSCPHCADAKKCAVSTDCTSTDCTSGFCCTPGSNRDGDSLDDCTEYGDNTPFTDPDIFNGLNGTALPVCTTKQTGTFCSTQDTVAEVRACAAMTASESMSQWSGWSWSQVSTPALCAASHNFSPDWTQNCTQRSWAVYYSGVYNFPLAGRYCFRMNPASVSNGACGTLILNGDGTVPLVITDTTTSAVCTTITAPTTTKIELYYQQNSGASSTYTFDPMVCYTATGSCTPTSTSKPLLSPQVLRNK